MLFGAVFVDPEVANHFADMAKFNGVKLGQCAIYLSIESYDSAMIRQPQCVPRRTRFQHALNVSEACGC